MARTPEDDWFPLAAARSSDLETDDEWLAGDDRSPGPTGFDPWSLVNRLVLVPTGFALVFLVALLAAFGAFSSGPQQTAGPTASTEPSVPTPSSPVPSSSSSPAPPTTTLKPGDSGTQVKILQQELAKLGYPVATIDGNYGPATTKAVAAFQRAHHLTADGVVGPSTLLALGP